MNNTIFRFDPPQSEPVESYAPGTPARDALKAELRRMEAETLDLPLIIGGKEVRTGRLGRVTMPTEHGHLLATYHQAGPEEVRQAIDAALEAKREWEVLSWVERASILLKVAELLSQKHRATINAATMLGQGKSAYQAEIDAAAETIDYLRWNAYFASRVYGYQPKSGFDH